MATIITVGYGYSLDMPQALEVPLRDEPYNFSSIEFNLLYIATSIPIIFTDIPLGIILDKFPLQITVVIIALTSFTAELLTAVLFDLRPTGYLYIVYVLRAIVGMAGSSAFTMQGFVIARYAAEHFEMLIGFSLCIPFIADSINVMLTPIIFDATQSISLPWYIASAVDFLAIVAALVISRIVINKEKRKKDEE